jgi:hypothetical protein
MEQRKKRADDFITLVRKQAQGQQDGLQAKDDPKRGEELAPWCGARPENAKDSQSAGYEQYRVVNQRVWKDSQNRHYIQDCDHNPFPDQKFIG